MAQLEPMTVGVAATRLQASEGTVRRWLRSGRLTGRKRDRGGPGGTWEVDAASVEHLAAQVSAEADTPATATVNARLLAEIAALREEVRRLSEQVAALPKALPAAPDETPEKRRPWWWRFWRW